MSFGTRASMAAVSTRHTWRERLENTARLTNISESTGDNTRDGTFAGHSHQPKRHLTLGIDYGTTNTSISYLLKTADKDDFEARASDIKTIGNYPDDENISTGGSKQVPTEIWYSPVPMARTEPSARFDEPLDARNGIHHSYVDTEDETTPSAGIAENEHESVAAASTPSYQVASHPDETKFLWGHSVALHRDHKGSARDPRLLVERPKLMMLSTEHTNQDRKKLRRQIKWLIKNKIIRKYGKKRVDDMRDVRDLITDFLVKVFDHTKQQLEIYEDFHNQCTVDFVLAVPTIWSPQASRILQASVEAAIIASSFGKVVNNKLGNLFIVPEPEGGVLYMLHKLPTAPYGEIISCLDCGGGTVDAATYQVINNSPLRLGNPIIDPTGDNCGGSYLNDNFKKHLLYRLRFETYLEVNGNTLESIVNRAARDFEVMQKPKIDIMNSPFRQIRIEYLRGDNPHDTGHMVNAKRFQKNWVLMDAEDYECIYCPILERVWDILKGQLEAARQQGSMVKMVFLVGGFAASPSLVSVLKLQLSAYEKEFKLPYSIRLIEDKTKSVVAVSAGAVLRALDKTNGPPRVMHSSYGFMRREAYDPTIAGHRNAHPVQDPDDEDMYIKVINYFLVKGTTHVPNHQFESIKMTHTFPIDDETQKKEIFLRCVEYLYVSDTATESHFPLKGPKNRDTQLQGQIVSDFTFLREEGLIDIVEPQKDGKGEMRGTRHYRIEYDLVPMIKGMDLIYESRWPSSDALERVESDRKRRRLEIHEFKKSAQISIAAAFAPGTS